MRSTFINENFFSSFFFTGAVPGGGGLGDQDPPPHTHNPFGGPPNFIKRGITSCMCTQIRHILVVNSYPDPSISNILYLPLEYYTS